MAFRALKSMHSLLPPSPLGTTTIGADQLVWLSLITPASRNLSISSQDLVIMLEGQSIRFLGDWWMFTGVNGHLNEGGDSNLPLIFSKGIMVHLQ